MTPEPLYLTASEIAAKLGIKRQAVQYHLKTIEPSCQVGVRGLQASAWTYEQLPAALREKAEQIARATRHRNGKLLFSQPTKNWGPSIPMPELHPDCIEMAVKLQRALAPSLERKNNSELNQQGRAAAGIKDYAAEFGHSISERHWWNLYDRTITRDGGAGNWARLEIYLPNNLKRKSIAGTSMPSAFAEFPFLHEEISNFKNPADPSLMEKSALWQKAFELYRTGNESGEPAKRLRRRLIAFLWRACPKLAKSENALRVAFDTRFARQSQIDGRTLKRGVPKAKPYEVWDIELVKYFSAKYTGGRVAQAARELNSAGLIKDARLKQALDTATSKSYLPTSFREHLQDVPAFQVCSLGPRASRKMVPPRELTYEGIFSMDCLVGDDETANVYVAVPNSEGWFDVIRPQLIPIIDFRSSRIVSRGVVPRPQYSAFDVRNSFKQAMMKYGIAKFILREGGLWRKSKLVNSLALIGTGLTASEQPFSPAETEYLLSEKKGIRICSSMDDLISSLGETGIRFRESFQPRSKPVEGVIRLLQTHTDRLPCRTGRDEKIDCPEETKRAVEAVRSRKAKPHEVGMMYFPQFVEEYNAICERYNGERQEGRKLRHPQTGAPLSPDEAFQIFQNTDDPPSPWDAQIAAILSSIKLECEVKSPRMRRRSFPCGFVEIRGNTYCSEETGRRIGKKLIAYYDPEFPESCTFEDCHTSERFTVPRLEPTNALHINEQTSLSSAQANRTISVVKADYKAMEAKYEPLLRTTILTRKTVELNREILQGRAENQEQQKTHQKNVQRAKRLAADVGIVQPAHAIDRSDPEDDKILRQWANRDKSKPEAMPAAPAGKTYFLKPDGNASKTPERHYIDYLLQRLCDFRKSGQKSFGQSFKGSITLHSCARIISSELQCDLYAPENFGRVCTLIQNKIDATILGKRNIAQGNPNYHSFEKENTA